MHDVTSQALMERLRYKLLMTMQEMRAGVFGIDRYATEFWVGSHPSIQPCDFGKAVTMDPKKPDLTDTFLSWLRVMGSAYQTPLDDNWFVPSAPHHKLRLPETWQVAKYRDVRLREYFLLPGNLFKWYFLYDEAPPLDSWVYQWFPDGKTWQDAIREHGNDSVNVVTLQALKLEAKSQRNRYTADRSTNLQQQQQQQQKKTVSAMSRGRGGGGGGGMR
jgi:hypothetical protein